MKHYSMICAALFFACSDSGASHDADLGDSDADVDRFDADIEDDADGSESEELALSVDLERRLDRRGLLTEGNVVGGALWFPLRQSSLVGPRLLSEDHELGAIRYNLQHLLDTPGQSRDAHLSALAEFQDLEFLRSFRERGGEVILNVHTMPEWASDRVTPNPECPDDFRHDPPVDYREWAQEVVVPIAKYFRDNLAAGLRYELGNEPDNCHWNATAEEFFQLYAAWALAIRSVDPTARIGAPSMGTGVWDLYHGPPNDRTGVDDTPFMRQLIAAAAAGHEGERLPLDFVSWHAFQQNPSSNDETYERSVHDLRTWLEEFGYDPDEVEVINDEWNYRAYQSCSENNVNTSHVNAAYAGSTMVAFHEAGLDNHASQTFNDVGGDVCSHYIASDGVPRAAFNVFKMLSRLDGDEVETTSRDPWFRTVSFVSDEKISIFVSHFVPTAMMTFSAARRNAEARDPSLRDVFRATPALVEDLLDFLESGELSTTLEDALTTAQQVLLREARLFVTEEAERREGWGVGPDEPDSILDDSIERPLSIELIGVDTAPRSARHTRVDSEHSVGHSDVVALSQYLAENLRGLACISAETLAAHVGESECSELDEYCETGDSSALDLSPPDPDEESCFIRQLFVIDIVDERSIDRTLAVLEEAGAAAATVSLFQDEAQAVMVGYQGVYQDMWTREEVRPHEEMVDFSFAEGRLRLDLNIEPFSVHLVEITR
jgi:hypothetical protein